MNATDNAKGSVSTKTFSYIQTGKYVYWSYLTSEFKHFVNVSMIMLYIPQHISHVFNAGHKHHITMYNDNLWLLIFEQYYGVR